MPIKDAEHERATRALCRKAGYPEDTMWRACERTGEAARSVMAYKEPDLAAQLAYMADHSEKFTRKEMAAMLAEAAEVIGILRTLVDMRADIELKDIEPEGNA